MAEDIQEQESIAGLKGAGQRAAAISHGEERVKTASLRCTIEVQLPLAPNPKEPETIPQAVATNDRAYFLRGMPPHRKSAPGVGLFVAGIGAT